MHPKRRAALALMLARDSLLSGTAGDWLVLDTVESGLLWSHLRAAR